ncbi:hypothetical protein DKM44_00830 [Deinococcus irradiatisoli]|uniref:Glycoside hydrolase family 38 central domain-containing protein n=1 Tax=Deinococcus irradiatisoli TaxID=2202254 RepID=A0A2Z3JJ34_9DEIO|nr:glycoside hydrolase family 38 C-terminal domain-containing protein [Deinococcus irradiatisoli]AWN21958.1 hypothetical protein DKM44_00830 [Deinococcus irradiatisoli]
MTTIPRPLTVHMYHHTHWDREWWSTRERFRFRLMHTVDAVLDALQADDSMGCFVLDGQTIALHDYLEVRPDRREELVALVRAGRLMVGPWFILPDEFLVSGEATIRNLWLGLRTAQALDIPLSQVGYLPDQFGHIAQMPQILRGFGLQGAVVWRGFGAPPLGQGAGTGETGFGDYLHPKTRDERFPTAMQNEFWWEAPDGSRVLGIWLPLEYYRGHYKVRPEAPDFTHDQTVGRARRTVNFLRQYSATDQILEPMGGDHLPVDARLPGLLSDLNLALSGDEVTYRLSSLDAYLAAVRTQQDQVSVVWRGEGRAFGRKAHLLPGVLSARLDLKARNAQVQTALERYAEPLQALAWQLGERYEQDYLWRAWSRLIENHPHDSICGCSIDQVHREMHTRFDEAGQMAELLAEDAYASLVSRIDASFAQGGLVCSVFNPLNWTRSEPARLLLNANLEIEPRSWELVDDQGELQPFQVRPLHHATEKAENFPWLGAAPTREHEQNAFTEVQFLAREVPGLGYRSFAFRKRAGPPTPLRVRPYGILGDVATQKGDDAPGTLRVGPGVLENEFLRVEVSPENGSLTLHDKISGLSYPGLNTFEDGGDNGDTYNYSWPLGDQVFSTRNLEPQLLWLDVGPVSATLRVTWKWLLPAGLSADRQSRSPEQVTLTLHSDLTLSAGARRLDICTHFDNPARDHRLQACFPLGAPAAFSSAETPFGVVERPTRLPADQRGSSEPAVHEHPQMTFVSVSGGERGLTVLNQGLPEFSADEAGTLRLTLLRSVGWLSREDLLTRAGGAGPTIQTPDAQRLGPVSAHYSLVPHAGTWHAARSWQDAHAFNAPLHTAARLSQVVPLRNRHRAEHADLPPSGQRLSLEGDVLLTALKRAEDREALIVRFVNQTPQEQAVTLSLPGLGRAERTNLREEPLEELPVEGGAVKLSARPWEIVTVALHASPDDRASH